LVRARGCIGASFALMEAQIILATLAQRFRLELVSGYPVKPDPTFALRPLGGLLMRVRTRGPESTFAT
jgi:cytochrome P450